MDISSRKKKILAAVIEEYIRTAEPVGSKAIAASADLGCSSATIRNELAELVAMGYLEQPHTSAGRVPTRSATGCTSTSSWSTRTSPPKRRRPSRRA